MIVYDGPLEIHPVIQFFRRESGNLRALRTLTVSREKTVVLDVNREGIEFPGLTYGSPVLESLLQELGVIFSPQTLHNPDATPSGVKEFRLSARWPWGHDRIL